MEEENIVSYIEDCDFLGVCPETNREVNLLYYTDGSCEIFRSDAMFLFFHQNEGMFSDLHWRPEPYRIDPSESGAYHAWLIQRRGRAKWLKEGF